MSVSKDKHTNTWTAQCRITDWRGKVTHHKKRGFKTKREGELWVRKLKDVTQGRMNMLFKDFVEIYFADMESRLREGTIIGKRSMFKRVILPYFADMKMCDITPNHIRAWQNEITNNRSKKDICGNISAFIK